MYSVSLKIDQGSKLFFFFQEKKNIWRSAEDLRTVKKINRQRSVLALTNCDCKDRNSNQECGFIHKEPKCNIQKESLSRQPMRQVSFSIVAIRVLLLNFRCHTSEILVALLTWEEY